MLRLVLLLALPLCVASTTGGSIVQFLVSADRQSDVVAAFPGSSVDFTWNNVFVVTIWTEDPVRAIPSIQATLDASPALRVLVAPYTLDAATQKWLQYHLLWISIIVLTFIAGCVCGATIVGDICAYKDRDRQRGRCPARF
jgi:hypothetical protein